ncbi:MAG: GNAT family N-acetyltransferase [Methanobrevibacter sp.]|uniref:GNAT family N-acetyltransferase n=1 Tax=Methanobrevibacter sp. TaxID=66852 RepID=UPI001B5EE7C9|nr:GNAT family N-acetyltransferase [Methanobrevibacter sp.]MBP3790534.1 GNAT family N-acetyltransferase [Methanobrevibacter sp.]
MEYVLKEFNGLSLDELYQIIQLRLEIFVVEQDCIYQDLDGKDNVAYHLFVKDDDEIVAVLRILPENVSYDEMAIGRIVVKKSHRGQGIAGAMMKRAMDFIVKDLGKNKIRLSGQAYLVDFYTNLGFKRVSDEYLEDGIPHFEFLFEC